MTTFTQMLFRINRETHHGEHPVFAAVQYAAENIYLRIMNYFRLGLLGAAEAISCFTLERRVAAIPLVEKNVINVCA